jgi:beta-lactamase superfamily II metal-dependent hydrolase
MGELHHLKVGCADCSVIRTSSHTFLVDASNISDWSHLLPSNKRLRGVFITHQHYDHFDGLKYLKDKGYRIDFLVHSPYERRYGDNSVQYDEWQEFNALRDHFVNNGTDARAPHRQTDFSKPWWDAGEVKFWILGPSQAIASSETRQLHDAALVVHAALNKLRCLFTGDASDANLEDVASNVNNICGGILHASHHGSIEGASLPFIQACKATHTVISTESGVHENVPHPTALRRYKENTSHAVYRTDVDGALTWTF